MNSWSRPGLSSVPAMDRIEIGVRYCGGCNPRYDRVALVKRLESLLPDLVLAPARPGARYPAVVVACGCPSRCANVSDLALPAGKLVYLSGWDDLLPAKERLEALGRAGADGDGQSLDHEGVLAILPHREPMLFVDTASRLIPGGSVTASFFVRPDLAVFQGHFPGSPTFPGVFLVESAAQASGLLLLTLDRYAGKVPLLVGVRKAGFHSRVVPGDTLELHVTLLEDRPELAAALCRGQVFVQDKLAADLELRLALR